MVEVYNIKVIELLFVILNGELVSLFVIRKKIVNLDFEGVIKFLDYLMLVIGEVIYGKKIVRELGFLIINIKMDNRLYLFFGIYGVFL